MVIYLDPFGLGSRLHSAQMQAAPRLDIARVQSGFSVDLHWIQFESRQDPARIQHEPEQTYEISTDLMRRWYKSYIQTQLLGFHEKSHSHISSLLVSFAPVVQSS